MDLLVIRTALPFGYAIVAIGLVVLAIGAVVAVSCGIFSRPRRPKLAVLGGILGFILVLVVWANIDAEGIDWNPVVGDVTDLVGRWHDGRSVLTLRADGSYACVGRACEEAGTSGRWTRHADFYVSFASADQPGAEWRLTSRDGRLRFANGDTFDNPDMWNTRLTFEHDSHP